METYTEAIAIALMLVAASGIGYLLAVFESKVDEYDQADEFFRHLDTFEAIRDEDLPR